MRLIFRCGLVREAPKPLPTVEASEEEGTPAARWFGASIDLKSLIAAAGLLLTLYAQHVNTQTTLTHLQDEIHAERSSAQQRQRQGDDRLKSIEARFNSEVVSRSEYQNRNRDESDRYAVLQAEVQQLYSIQFGHAGR